MITLSNAKTVIAICLSFIKWCLAAYPFHNVMNEVKSYFYRQQYFLSTWAHECCNISVIFDVQAFFFSSLIHFEHIISGGKYIHKSFFFCVWWNLILIHMKCIWFMQVQHRSSNFKQNVYQFLLHQNGRKPSKVICNHQIVLLKMLNFDVCFRSCGHSENIYVYSIYMQITCYFDK